MNLLSTHWEITARKRMVWVQQFISDFIFQFAAKKAKEMGRKIAWDEKKNTKLIQISSSLKTSLVLRYFARQGVLFARFLRHTNPLGTPVYLAFFARHFFFSHAPYFMLQFTTSSINIIILQTRPVLLLWYYPLYYDIFVLHFTFNFYIYI